MQIVLIGFNAGDTRGQSKIILLWWSLTLYNTRIPTRRIWKKARGHDNVENLTGHQFNTSAGNAHNMSTGQGQDLSHTLSWCLKSDTAESLNIDSKGRVNLYYNACRVDREELWWNISDDIKFNLFGSGGKHKVPFRPLNPNPHVSTASHCCSLILIMILTDCFCCVVQVTHWLFCTGQFWYRPIQFFIGFQQWGLHYSWDQQLMNCILQRRMSRNCSP